MGLTFEPPRELIEGSLNQQSPWDQAGTSIQQALQTYVALKQQAQAKAIAEQQRKLEGIGSAANVFKAGGPDLLGRLSPQFSAAGIDTSAFTQAAPAPTPAPIPMSVPVTAGVLLPGGEQPAIASGSPLVQASIAAGHGKRQRPDVAALSRQGEYGQEQLDIYNKGLNSEKLERELDRDPNAPVPVLSREAALKAGQVSPNTKILDDGSDKDSRFATQQAATLRGQYIRDSEKFQSMGQSLAAIQSQVKNPSPAGDIGLMYQLAKMWDPQTGVKEGELALPSQAGNVPTQLIAQYNRLVKGERFTPEQRKDFVNQAMNLYKSAHEGQKRLISSYTQQAAAIPGVDPKQVIIDYSVPIEEQQSSAWDAARESRYQELLRKRGGR